MNNIRGERLDFPAAANVSHELALRRKLCMKISPCNRRALSRAANVGAPSAPLLIPPGIDLESLDGKLAGNRQEDSQAQLLTAVSCYGMCNFVTNLQHAPCAITKRFCLHCSMPCWCKDRLHTDCWSTACAFAVQIMCERMSVRRAGVISMSSSVTLRVSREDVELGCKVICALYAADTQIQALVRTG